jgi:hypothetical protein
MGEARGMHPRFSLLFQTNLNWRHDVLVNRDMCLMQQPLRTGDP